MHFRYNQSLQHMHKMVFRLIYQNYGRHTINKQLFEVPSIYITFLSMGVSKVEGRRPLGSSPFSFMMQDQSRFLSSSLQAKKIKTRNKCVTNLYDE